MLDDIGLEIIADLVGIPLSSGKQALHAIRGRGTKMFSDLPAILAFNWTDQRAEIVVGLLTWFGANKMLGDPLVQSRQSDRPAPNLCNIKVFHNHARLLLSVIAWLLLYQVRL